MHSTSGIPVISLEVFVGALYGLAGVCLTAHPQFSLFGLTLGFAILLSVEGLIESGFALLTLTLPGGGWLLPHGITTLLLSAPIWIKWPSDANLMLGTVLGINLIVSGITKLLYLTSPERAVAVVIESKG